MSGSAAGYDDNVHFSSVDYVVFSLLLVVSWVLGVGSAYRTMKKKEASANDYLMGGGTMSPVAVALSLLGGALSAIAVLGTSTESYFYGTQYSVCILGMALGGLINYHIIIPVLYNPKVVSMNYYLELRFGSARLRRLVSGCQILCMVLVMAVVLYAPALALSTATRLTPLVSVLSTSAVSVIYTTIGGVRSVVYTDVLQTMVMFLGMVVVVVVGSLEQGGATQVWSTAIQGHRIQFLELDADPFLRHSFWSTVVVGMYLIIYFYGFNQSAHQRFSSVNSLVVAKRICMVAVSGCIILVALCTAAGLVSYAVYNGCDPLMAGRISKPDQILPYLVVDKLGYLTGVPGVFVAALYGGVLSSVSSFCNSLACMMWDDFLCHAGTFKRMSSKGATTVLKLLSLAFGVLGTCLALTVGGLGNVLQLAVSIVGAVNGPIFGIFFTGMCTPWVAHKLGSSGCGSRTFGCACAMV